MPAVFEKKKTRTDSSEDTIVGKLIALGQRADVQ